METNFNLIECPYCGKMNSIKNIKCTCGFYFSKAEYDKEAKRDEEEKKMEKSKKNQSSERIDLKHNGENESSFPMLGVVVGSIGLLLLVLSFFPHDKGIGTLPAIVILIIGAIIGANVQVYFQSKYPDFWS